ncbi:response regulator [Nocardioides ferulae]|uniref:response regulator n=1 Tax=Nocardioides ferulae TaxID=2340821 RepID=UPI000EB2E0BB|nr:response regulator [Nocardioides ferulae]
MTAAGSANSTASIRVLLVDDAEDIRRLIRTALRFRGGFEVVGEAATGAEAVAQAAELHPDIVVLDLGLPDLAGRDLIARVRESSPPSQVVVFSAAEASDPSWFEDRTAGYVLKDADLDYLVDLLESVAAPRPDEAVLDLPQDLASVKEARRFVMQQLLDWGLESMRDDAFLVVSELAANALTHAASDYQVRLSLSPTALRIEICDSGTGTPEPQPPTMTQDHGRGLLMVSALSASWGIDVGPGEGSDAAGPGSGKVVWAELTRAAPSELSWSGTDD